jgi:hypothetical protein
MARTELQNLTERVRDDIECHVSGLAARRKLLQDLLTALATARPGGRLAELAEHGECRGLATHLRALLEHLREASQLPEALAGRYLYKLSPSRAMQLYRTPRSAWDAFHALADELDWDPVIQQEVMLDAAALESMLIAAMEAYLAPRKSRRKGYEIYGLSMGMTRDVPHTHPRNGVRMTRYVSVMRSQVQLSADGAYLYVEPNPQSLDAIVAVTKELYPQFEVVGDFHSHPHKDLQTLHQRGGWTPSDSDEDVNVDFAETLREMGHHLLVSFVVAIARCPRRVKRGHFRGLRNTIQMSVGSCRVIVAAYRSFGSGRLSAENISLGLSGMVR